MPVNSKRMKTPFAVGSQQENPLRLNRYATVMQEEWSSTPSAGAGGKMIEIEFTIHSDGRVEQTVKGAKGRQCIDITEKINEALGEVYETEPTVEMYEQEVVVV